MRGQCILFGPSKNSIRLLHLVMLKMHTVGPVHLFNNGLVCLSIVCSVPGLVRLVFHGSSF